MAIRGMGQEASAKGVALDDGSCRTAKNGPTFTSGYRQVNNGLTPILGQKQQLRLGTFDLGNKLALRIASLGRHDTSFALNKLQGRLAKRRGTPN